jgi:predicted esterase
VSQHDQHASGLRSAGCNESVNTLGGGDMRVAGLIRLGKLMRHVVVGALLVGVAAQSLAQNVRDFGWRRGDLLSALTVARLSKAQIDASVAALGGQAAGLVGPAQCDVRVDFISYGSVGPHGEQVSASGVVLSPIAGPGCAVPSAATVLSYQHATRFKRSTTLSSPFDQETQALIAIHAARGRFVVATDYLGYFASTLPYHPYLHADSEANVAVDALRAARRLLHARGVSIGSVIALGYSQGGHSTMALHRALEQSYAGEFPFQGSAPMAGPYALEETFLLGSLTPFQDGTANSAFALVAHNRVYRNIYKSPMEAFKLPYATWIETLLPGPYELAQLYALKLIPESIADLANPGFLASFQSNPNHPFRQSLRANTLTLGPWKPTAPMLLCHGARDPVVPFFNTVRAQAAFTGSPVQVIEIDSFFNLPPFQNEQEQLIYHQQTEYLLCMVATRGALFGP